MYRELLNTSRVLSPVYIDSTPVHSVHPFSTVIIKDFVKQFFFNKLNKPVVCEV